MPVMHEACALCMVRIHLDHSRTQSMAVSTTCSVQQWVDFAVYVSRLCSHVKVMCIYQHASASMFRLYGAFAFTACSLDAVALCLVLYGCFRRPSLCQSSTGMMIRALAAAVMQMPGLVLYGSFRMPYLC